MNYGKQFKKILSAKDDNTALVGVALISGLAIGAALAVLFAPKKGSELREGISGTTSQLGGTLTDLMDAIKAKFGKEEDLEAEVDHNEDRTAQAHAHVKKPKSDIGEIIHQAHHSGESAVHQN
ncbi:MAG: YtxH domain-containing protein [Bacteroidota bacterium]